MNPTPSDRHISTPLTAMSIAYAQSSDEFVARRVFPVVPSDKQYDKYYEFTQADFNRVQMAQRAPSTESAEGRYRLSNNAYACDVFALHKDIDDRERSNADAVFNLDAEASEFLTHQSLLKEEVDFASKYLVASVWGTTITGVASSPVAGTSVLQWNDGASDPIANIRTGIRTIKGRTGLRPNKFVVSQEAWDQLVDHPDILDRIKGAASPSSPAIVLRQAVAALFELDEILVMGAIVNSAAENQTASHTWIAGKTALLVHAAMRPARMTPSAGYTFAWTNYATPGTPNRSPVGIYRFRMDHLKSDRVEIESAYVQQITGAPLGYLFKDIVA